MAKNKQTYTLQIDAEIGSLESKLSSVKGLLSGVLGSVNAPKGLEKAFGKIEGLIDKIKTKAAQPIDSTAGFSAISRDVDSAQVALTGLMKIVKSINSMSEADKISFLPPEMQKQIEKVVNSLAAYAQAMDAASTETEELVTAREKLADAEERVAAAQARVNSRTANLEAAKAEQRAAEDGIRAIEERRRKLAELREEQERIEEFYNTPNEDGTRKNRSKKYAGVSARPQDIRSKILELETASAGDADALEKYNDDLRNAKENVRSYQTQLNTATRALNDSTDAYNTIKEKVDELNAAFESNKPEAQQRAFAELRASAEALGVSLEGISESYSESDANELVARITALKTKGLDKVKTAANGAGEELEDFGDSCKDVKGKIEAGTEALEDMNEAASQQKAFEDKIKAFLGIQGAAQVMRAALRDAMQTITELDATMTEMSVVTDLGVSDYWNQLPEYTNRANALGLAINDVYKADTLFYQQGLKTQEVVEISTETMKMARIAGLDTAEATNRMTAALRGFNMELNQTSAQKVADVYSELAAITAADTEEISSAMTKTASIASSAGMEFETTAAFLSQIIETTRESAETAGTAMKTIIARFQELKKDPAEIGEVDGEIVDANKIEGALRSVGVSLRDASGQFRDLDDVFIELASKWDDLDKNTQRYIATIAAGSRQQSRFIAMMSDYGRTQELVTAATTSAGASNDQFAKTLDSLESKVAKLKNAWHEFTMGILDSDLVKFGVDVLTKFLEVVNKATDGLGDNGFGGALMKIAGVFAIFKMGMKIFNKFETPIMSLFKNVTKWAGVEGFKSGKAYTEAAERGAQSVMNKADTQTQEETNANESGTNSTGDSNTKKPLKQQLGEWIGFNSFQQAKQASSRASYYRTIKSDNYKPLYDKKKSQLADLDNKYTFGKNGGVYQKGKRGQLTAAEAGKIKKEYADLSAEIEEYNNAETEYAKASKEKWSNISKGISAAGQAMTTVGMTMSMVGGLLSSMGLEEAGSVISDIGQAITMVGGALMAIPPILTLITTHPIIAVITAFLALVLALTVGIISAVNNSSPEAKLQKAAENAEAAAEAAERATDAYNDLSNSFDELGDKYKVLEGLREGTEEWNEAVQEINSSVLDLISQYPELAGLVENEGGVLSLEVDSDEAQKILREAKAAQVAAQGASLGAKMSVEQAKREVELNQIDPDTFDAFKTESGFWAGTGAFFGATGTGAMTGALGTAAATAWANGVPIYGQAAWGGATAIGAIVGAIVGAIGGIPAAIAASDEAELRNETNRENFKEIAQAFANGETGTTQTEIASWIEEQGIAVGDAAQKMAAEVLNSANEIAKYGESLNAMDAATKAYYQAMATNAQQLIDLGSYTDEQINQMTEVIGEDLMAQYKKQYEDELTQGADGSDSDEYKQAKKDFAKEVYGENARVDGNKILDEKGEVIREFTNEEAFINEMAAAEATKQAAEAMKEVPGIINQSLSKVAANVQEAFRKAFEGEDLTKGELESFKQSLGQGIKDEATGDIDYVNVKSMWDELSDEQKTTVYGGTDEAAYERFEATFTGILDAQTEAFSKADENIKSMLGETATYSKKLSSAAAQAWTNNLKDISTAGGDIDTLNSSLTNMLSGLSEEEAELVMQQVNAIDKMDKGAWEGLTDTFEQLGISIPTAQLNAFIQSGIKVSGAIEKINFDTLATDINNTYKLLEKIKEGGRTYTAEDYKELVAGNQNLAKSFTQVGDEFLYVGGSIEDLKDAVKANTDTTLQEANRQRQSRANMSKIINENATNFGSVDAMDKQHLTDYLVSMRDDIYTAGGDLGDFGIEGLSMNTSFVDASLEQLQKWASALATEGSDAKLQYYENDAVEGLRQANIQRYVRNDASYNAQQAISGGEFAGQHQEALLLQAINSGGVSDQLIKSYREAIDTGNQELIASLSETISDATDRVIEVSDSRDAYVELVQRVTAAIEKSRQEEIDKLSEVNDSINSANDAMLNKIQQQIDSNRQARENEKTEKDLTKMRSQQAYLAMDSSGANALQALELETQIADAEQNYQDTLVDQALQDLQDSNEKAAEQRERQIELMQKQLDASSKSGEIAAQAAEIAHTGALEIQSGVAPLETALGQLLWGSEGDGLGALEQENWVNELQTAAVKTEEYLRPKKSQDVSGPASTPIAGEKTPISAPEAPIETTPIIEAAESEQTWLQQFWNTIQTFFSQTIPNWWNTYLAPIFTGEFWSEKWAVVQEWWNTNIAPLFTGEFWSEKFFAAGVAVGEFFKQIGEAFVVVKDYLADAWEAFASFFTETIPAWWEENIAFIFEKEFWLEKWDTVRQGLADAWSALVSFFTETIPTWWEENIEPLFTKDFWEQKWNSIKEGLSAAWNNITKFFTETIPAWWEKNIAPIFTADYWEQKWNSIKEGLAEAWSGVKQWWNDNIVTWWNDNIAPIFTKDYWEKLVKNIGDGLKTGFEAAINAVIKGINAALKKLADIYNKSIGSFIAGIASVFGGEDVGKITYTEIKPVKFKEGGLADFTGPAWLDGTKSKPEYVLNAEQTERFFTLIDVLEGYDADKGQGAKGGDNYFDIEINVEKLENDYDVEQVAEKIRRMIYNDATYRNVNAVNLIR